MPVAVVTFSVTTPNVIFLPLRVILLEISKSPISKLIRWEKIFQEA